MAANEELTDVVVAVARESDGKRRLTCAEAFALARRFDAKVVEIGRICDEQKIRICKCQLGCFE
ncbi:MAG: hypothetical protein JSU70_14410 [Phycisphaerales bacterium]|nr:MAG: hypothetical protein JSU70_14410 [Phycisphaerales bacterium]